MTQAFGLETGDTAGTFDGEDLAKAVSHMVKTETLEPLPLDKDLALEEPSPLVRAARKVGRPIRSKTALHPREAAHKITLYVLRIAARFKLIRVLDIAMAVFPERELKPALNAAHRATSRLCKTKFLIKYRSDVGHTYYGLTKAGATWLRDNGETGEDGIANSTASAVSTRINPEHEMWANTIVLACEARGMKAWSENDVKQILAQQVGPGERAHLLTVKSSRTHNHYVPDKKSKTGKTLLRDRVLKGLMPDSLAETSNGMAWIEVDRSKRGADRLADLSSLVNRLGNKLEHVHEHQFKDRTLRRVVVLCKHENTYKANLDYLTARLTASADEDQNVSRLVPIPGIEGAFEVFNYVEVPNPAFKAETENGFPMVYEFGQAPPKTLHKWTWHGYLNVLLLPIWLPRFSRGGEVRTTGWLGDNYLPWPEPAGWGETVPVLPV